MLDNKSITAKVQSAVTDLMEHFDVVQIFVSSYDKDTLTTTSYALGEGNLNARKGQVAEWIKDTQNPIRVECLEMGKTE